MNPNVTDKYRQWAPVYVLGSLIPSERREYELHLAGCSNCAAAVTEIAWLPDLLAVLTPKEAQAVGAIGNVNTPPESLSGPEAKVLRWQRARLAFAGLVMGVRGAHCGGH
ncbi:zf-HC2 domain-containing protein [Pseudarthrobacter cellobiosi]|uniref:zf-HC2 domain-containing protein n=1 Tax=Pseudarthrobacter cellobiosi TaxID=2953654 RepID=UPI00208E2D2F|nr:zf-HC2 domain-containing protein [Pseudarthrobacter sp. HLT1-5]MCO4254487.1 zf-HC2 domain-containing protein [Pseudarthrobacter sp. HLT1-5]